MENTCSPPVRPLQPRLFEFGIAVCRWTHGLPRSPAGLDIAQRSVRSAMSAAAHHAEAGSAQSAEQFLDKLKSSLQDLRETAVWLHAARRVGYDGGESSRLRRECRDLTAIFVASVATLRTRQR